MRDSPIQAVASPPTFRNHIVMDDLRGEALLAYVRNVAEDLRQEFDRAQEATAGWTNVPLAEALVDAAVSRCLVRLEATGVVGEANRLPSSALWNLLGDRLSQSWLVNRARTKPRGYAGDYELLDWICEERIGEHPFGRTLDRFFQNQAAPAAVRARTDLAAAEMVRHYLNRPPGEFRIVSVGAGPAADVRKAAAMLPLERRRDLHVTLLDVDPAALDFAKQKLAELLPADRIEPRQVNLMRLPQRGEALPEGDFLICPGLFDYLDDNAAADMLALFWRRLAPGGRLLTGNFAVHPTRSYMEWIGNWYLLYRTPADLRALAGRAGLSEVVCTVAAERYGIDLFLTAERP